MISDATAVANSRLLANWLLSSSKGKLVLPDYRPPLVEILRSMRWDCSHVMLPFKEDAPVICNACRQQVGTVSGLACAVSTVHEGCTGMFTEPPWFKTDGLYQIAYAAFSKHSKGGEAIALLLHYIITEYIAGDFRNKQLQQREQELNELSRYRTSQSHGNGFERIESLF